MEIVKNRLNLSFFITSLYFILMLVSIIIEHTFYELPASLLPFWLSIELVLYTNSILLLPTYFINNAKKIFYSVSGIAAIALSNIVFATTLYILLIDLLILLVFYLISLRSYQSIKYSINIDLIGYVDFLESKTYNLLEMAAINYIFNVVFISLTGFYNTNKLVFMIAGMLVYLPVSYKILFKQRLTVSHIQVYLLNALSILIAYTSSLIGVQYMRSYIVILAVIAALIPYTVTTVLIIRELKSYSIRFR